MKTALVQHGRAAMSLRSQQGRTPDSSELIPDVSDMAIAGTLVRQSGLGGEAAGS